MFDFDLLTLNRPLSTTSPSDPDDVLTAKRVFRRLGYYEIPRYGLTPYPDQPLFDGIRDYQRDNDLTVDGVMHPGGETEQSVNFSLATEERKTDNADREACAEQAIFQLPGLPWPRRNYCPTPDDKPSEEDCEQPAQDDEDRCRRISDRYGPYRARRCFASANLRYGNCKAGRPNFPNLDTGEY